MKKSLAKVDEGRLSRVVVWLFTRALVVRVVKHSKMEIYLKTAMEVNCLNHIAAKAKNL